ncbi:hypothetical protein [Paenibacillus sp. FSL R7-0179]
MITKQSFRLYVELLQPPGYNGFVNADYYGAAEVKSGHGGGE